MPSALLPRTPARSKICLHGSFWSWNHQISPTLLELSKLTNLFEDRRSTPEDCEVGFCSLAQLFTSFSGCRLANSFGAYFGDTLGLPLSCRRQSCGFFGCCFFCWRNANLAGRFACRRCVPGFCLFCFLHGCMKSRRFIPFAIYLTASLTVRTEP